MSKPSTTTLQEDVSSISKTIKPEYALQVKSFFNRLGVSDPDIKNYEVKDFYSDLVCHHIKVSTVERGRVSCFVTVKPAVTNYFNGLHGGAVAAFAERVAIACARTVVAEDKELFLAELSMAYLSSAPQHSEILIDGSVVKSGRNVTVVAMEFKQKDSGKLLYIARATFFNSPVSKL